MSTKTTRAPSLANKLAVAAPIPEAAPVTMATRFFSFNMINLFLNKLHEFWN